MIRYCSLVKSLLRWPLILVLAMLVFAVQAQTWLSLQKDKMHDPDNPGLRLLQQPGEALVLLPPDSAGNKVDWVKALTAGYIQPRGGLRQDRPSKILDTDIIMTGNGAGSLPFVRFPHKPHTEWLDCSNCHDKLFQAKAGATPVSMLAILEGEYCGRCHGAVSFPLTECNRCHTVLQDSVRLKPSP